MIALSFSSECLDCLIYRSSKCEFQSEQDSITEIKKICVLKALHLWCKIQAVMSEQMLKHHAQNIETSCWIQTLRSKYPNAHIDYAQKQKCWYM